MTERIDFSKQSRSCVNNLLQRPESACLCVIVI